MVIVMWQAVLINEMGAVSKGIDLERVEKNLDEEGAVATNSEGDGGVE